jgi:hypothetical protein
MLKPTPNSPIVLEKFSAGRWQQRFQYKSFEPVPVNHAWIWEDAVINAGDMEQALSVATPTANSLIKALVELNILKEMTGQQRWRSYAFERYLSLFLS